MSMHAIKVNERSVWVGHVKLSDKETAIYSPGFIQSYFYKIIVLKRVVKKLKDSNCDLIYNLKI